MRKLTERFLIKVLKKLNADLLPHAHVQMGAGHNTYNSGEEELIPQLKSILQKWPELIFDVGANVGLNALQMAAVYPNATIHCFEPVPVTFETLRKNTAGINTINTQTAMGDLIGIIDLYIGNANTDGSMASAYKTPLEQVFTFVGEVNQTVKAPLTTLDNYCQINSIPAIDFLKIDVEGHELSVLKGAERLIKNDAIKLIQFEFNEFNIFSKTYMYDFYQVLPNFDFYRIKPLGILFKMGEYSSKSEIFRYQNILAIHKDLKYANG